MNDNPALRQSPQADTAPRTAETLLPPVDVIEDGAGITLYADLPGVPKDKLHLHVEADTLTIEGEIALPAPEGLESIHSEVGLPCTGVSSPCPRSSTPTGSPPSLPTGCSPCAFPRWSTPSPGASPSRWAESKHGSLSGRAGLHPLRAAPAT
jgi:hypothetical protein